MTCTYDSRLLKGAVCLTVLAVLGMGQSRPSRAQLPPASLPPRPTPGLPARPPTPMPPAQVAAQQPAANGTHIILRIQPPGDYWTEVEWEDMWGGWHLVEGWRTSTAQGQVIWFVAPADFGTGPFRWRVYDLSDKRLLATSERFRLPLHQGGGVIVEMTVQQVSFAAKS